MKKLLSSWLTAIRGLIFIIRQKLGGYKPLCLPENLCIETARFLLAPIRKGDKESVFITMNCPETANIVSFMKWPVTMEQASALCSESMRGLAWKRGLIFLARHKSDSYPIGCIGLKLTNEDHSTAEVGYWVSENWKGKGCATEMLKAIINFAFTPPCSLSRLIATAAFENQESIRVLHKQGFQMIGRKDLNTAKGTLLDGHSLIYRRI